MSFPTFTSKITPLILCGLLIGSTAIVRADDGSMSGQAHDLLVKAESETGTDQQNDLKSALEIMHNLPAGNRKARTMADRDVNSALFESQRGDPSHLVSGFLRDAEDKLDRIRG